MVSKDERLSSDIFTFRLANYVCGVRRFIHCCENWNPVICRENCRDAIVELTAKP